VGTAYLEDRGVFLQGYQNGSDDTEFWDNAGILFVRIQVETWGIKEGDCTAGLTIALIACWKNWITERPWLRQVCTTVNKLAFAGCLVP